MWYENASYLIYFYQDVFFTTHRAGTTYCTMTYYRDHLVSEGFPRVHPVSVLLFDQASIHVVISNARLRLIGPEC